MNMYLVLGWASLALSMILKEGGNHTTASLTFNGMALGFFVVSMCRSLYFIKKIYDRRKK